MRLCVFGAASTNIDGKYIELVEAMSYELAKKGNNLVFGAGGTGLMGAAARGFKAGNAHILGVIPTFFRDEKHVIEPIFEGCDDIIYTETMRERKAIMEDNAEAFIIVPGGIGTFEEFFEILTLKELCRHNKKIVIFNIDGYYDAMLRLLNESTNKGFVSKNVESSYNVFDNVEDIVKYFS